jgi:preprotein translocase subunit SecB
MGEETRSTAMHQDNGDSTVKGLETSAFPFQLKDVRLFHINAERHTPEQEGKEPPFLSVLLVKGKEPSTSPEFSLWLQFETELPHGDAPECSISLSIEGHFEVIADPTTLKPEVIEQFKEADAILLLWPYLREALHNLTDRMHLGVPPLPVIDARALLARSVEEPINKE